MSRGRNCRIRSRGANGGYHESDEGSVKPHYLVYAEGPTPSASVDAFGNFEILFAA